MALVPLPPVEVREVFPSPEALLADTDFLLSVQEWGRKGKATNTHLERLLSRYRHAARTGADGPLYVQRVVAGGCMSQARHAHRAGGGADPCSLRRKDLLRKGVPLKAGSRRRRCPQRRRAKLLYAHERWLATPSEARLGCKYPEWVKRMAGEFESLPAEEQQRRRSDAKRRGPTDAESIGGAGDDNTSGVAGTDPSVLWGRGTADLPIDDRVAELHIREKFGIGPERPTFGFNAWGATMSEPFLKHMLVTDSGCFERDAKATWIPSLGLWPFLDFFASQDKSHRLYIRPSLVCPFAPFKTHL